MQEISESSDSVKKLTDFYCHKMVYTLFWGDYYCISCSQRKFINPERKDRQAIRVQRHFLISEPRPNRRICCSCEHPLMFICRAQYCPHCHEYYRDNAESLEYEDGCVDIPLRTPSSSLSVAV